MSRIIIGMAFSLDKIRKNLEKAKEDAARRSANFFQFKEGRNLIRILPPWEGAEDISRPMGKHWNLGPEGKDSVFCPRHCCDGAPCPICEEIDRRWKAKPDDATKDYLRSIGASQRYYVNLLDLNDLDKGVQIGELPKTVLEEIWTLMVDADTGLGDITSWDAGYDLIVEKTGKGLLTRYNVKPKRTPSAISRELYAPKLFNLDNFVKTMSYTDLKLVWEGKSPAALPAPTAAATAAPAHSHASDPDVVDAETVETTVAKKAAAGLPACFGSFNADDPKCLDCAEQDDCESKMLEERKKAAAAAAKRTPAPAPAPAAAAKPAPAATPAPAVGDLDADALMREMEAAIKS